MRRILRKIAANEYKELGDVSTLADPTVVENLIKIDKINRTFDTLKIDFFFKYNFPFKSRDKLHSEKCFCNYTYDCIWFCFVMMHGTVKYLSEEIHPFEIAFFRNAFVIVVLAPIILSNTRYVFVSKQPKIQIYRILLNSVALICFFYGLSITVLAEATALGFTVPIFATILSILFLKEKIRIRRFSALIIGFIGTLIVLRPDISIQIGSF